MRIKTFQKQKNGQYRLQLEDGEEFFVYEDLILKYELLLHKQLTDEMRKQLEIENKKQEAYYTALRYLKRQIRSQKEVEDYLKRKEYGKEMIEYSISQLKKQGYLNDQSYAKSFVSHQLLFTSNGPAKIRQELQKKGIDEIEIVDALEEYTEDKMEEKIKKWIHKLTKSNHNKSNQALKMKIIEQLINQGFPKSRVLKSLSEETFQDDQELAKKEYDKLYRKLSRKYQGQELDYKIKQKMYQKGFSYEQE